jgi:cyclohexadienyl dehydratase
MLQFQKLMNRFFLWFYAAIPFLLLLGSPVMAGDKDIKQSVELFTLVQKRLSMMQQVALYKYVHQLPLVNPEVERKILQQVKEDAKRYSLAIKETEHAIQVQMQVAVVVQKEWHDNWKKNGLTTQAVPDLDKEIRPELTRITHAIVEQLAAAREELSDLHRLSLLLEAIDEIVDVPYVSHEQKDEILQALIVAARKSAV